MQLSIVPATSLLRQHHYIEELLLSTTDSGCLFGRDHSSIHVPDLFECT